MSRAVLALTTRAHLEAAAATLAAVGVATARNDAEWLLADVLGLRRLELYRVLDRPLPELFARRYDGLVQRRARREPLQRILGYEEFYGLRFGLTNGVLVPRPETEALVEWALALLAPPRPSWRPVVADVGTGSGCVACAVAHERPDATVLAVDVSFEAACLAARNAAALGLARVRSLIVDRLSALGRGRLDLIVANLPYLPTELISTLAPEVAAHEPRVALDGGRDGLAVIRPLLDEGRRVLRAPGWLVLETAGGEQAGTVAGLLQAAGFVDVASRADLTGTVRFVAGRIGEGG